MSDRERPLSGQSTLPRRFAIWPGVLAALVFGGALAAATALGLLGESMSGLVGGLVNAGHALTVVAVVTTLGEMAKIVGWGHQLEECRQLPDDDRTGWPIFALDDALKRLYRRHSTAELYDEIRKTEELILERQQWTWRLAQIVAFLLPAIGFAASLWNLHWEGNKLPYRELGWPLVISLGEAILVLLLALWVRSAAQTLLREWRLFCQEVCAIRRPRGEIEDEHEDEDEDGPEPEAEKAQPVPVISVPPPAPPKATPPKATPPKPTVRTAPTPIPAQKPKPNPWADI